jgi:hypothetical protein
MCIGLHVKYPLFLAHFNELEYSRQIFEKNPQICNLMKIRPVEAELFHADGRTDTHDEDNSRFLKFCERA